MDNLQNEATLYDLAASEVAGDDGKRTTQIKYFVSLPDGYWIATSSEHQLSSRAKTVWEGPFEDFDEAADAWGRTTGRDFILPHEEERVLSLWDSLSVSLLLVGLITFWMALAVGMWVGPIWGVVGLFAWCGSWLLAACCIGQAGRGEDD